MRIKSYLYLLSCVFLVCFSSCTQSSKNKIKKQQLVSITNSQIDTIKSFIAETSLNHHIPGITFGLISNDKNFESFYGVIEKDSENKINSQTKLNGLEFSELFVATAILKLKEKGKLKLSDPLVKHLPYFKLRDSIDSRKITIQHLLTHTSGLPEVSINLGINPEQEDPLVTPLEVTTRGIHGLLKDFDAGKKYKKSFLNYDILADLISKVSKLSFAEYMQKEIFEPLKMNATTYYFNTIDSLKLSKNYHLENHYDIEPTQLYYYPFNKENLGSNGVHTTTKDILKWAKMILNNGVYEDKTFLKKETLAYFLKPFHSINTNEYIGYSWQIDGKKNDYRYYKSFSDHGFSSSLILYPNYNIALVVQTNLESDLDIELLPISILNYLIEQKKEINGIKIPYSKTMFQLYKTKGVQAALDDYNEMKMQNTRKFDFSFNEMIKFINYILKSVETEEDLKVKKEESLQVLSYCEKEFSNPVRLALTYADTYFVFKDTIQVNSYIKKAKELSNNDPEVLKYSNDLLKRMREKESVFIIDN